VINFRRQIQNFSIRRERKQGEIEGNLYTERGQNDERGQAAGRGTCPNDETRLRRRTENGKKGPGSETGLKKILDSVTFIYSIALLLLARYN
jgi:hypothetical protein